MVQAQTELELGLSFPSIIFLEVRASHELTVSVTQSLQQSFLALKVYIDLFCPLWSCIVLYGPLFSRTVPFGTEWSCMLVYGAIWSRIVQFGPEWSPMVRMAPMFLYEPG